MAEDAHEQGVTAVRRLHLKRICDVRVWLLGPFPPIWILLNLLKGSRLKVIFQIREYEGSWMRSVGQQASSLRISRSEVAEYHLEFIISHIFLVPTVAKGLGQRPGGILNCYEFLA